MRSQTERLHPPRALYCEFPFGRPLGRPGDAAFQRSVLMAALALLARPEAPVLEDFPEIIEDETDSPMSCALPPWFDQSLPEAVDETLALVPAYKRHLARTGRTSMGRAIGVEKLAEAVLAFIRVCDGVPVADALLPGRPTEVALDVRSFFEEVAVEISDHVPSARAAESWFYQSTATGRLLLRVREVLKAAGVERDTWFFIAPQTQ